MVTLLAKLCQHNYVGQGQRIRDKIAVPDEVISLGDVEAGQIAARNEVISLSTADSGEILSFLRLRPTKWLQL
jgi:hypothetical protein